MDIYDINLARNNADKGKIDKIENNNTNMTKYIEYINDLINNHSINGSEACWFTEADFEVVKIVNELNESRSYFYVISELSVFIYNETEYFCRVTDELYISWGKDINKEEFLEEKWEKMSIWESIRIWFS